MSQNGFVLIEIPVSCLLLGVMLSGFFAMQFQALQTEQTATEIVLAAQQLVNLHERLAVPVSPAVRRHLTDVWQANNQLVLSEAKSSDPFSAAVRLCWGKRPQKCLGKNSRA